MTHLQQSADGEGEDGAEQAGHNPGNKGDDDRGGNQSVESGTDRRVHHYVSKPSGQRHNRNLAYDNYKITHKTNGSHPGDISQDKEKCFPRAGAEAMPKNSSLNRTNESYRLGNLSISSKEATWIYAFSFRNFMHFSKHHRQHSMHFRAITANWFPLAFAFLPK